MHHEHDGGGGAVRQGGALAWACGRASAARSDRSGSERYCSSCRRPCSSSWPSSSRSSSMLAVAVENRELREVMPRTAAAMMAWDGAGVPPPATVATFVGELRQATADGSIGRVARRLNYAIPGLRSILLRTGRSLPPPETPDADLLAALAGIDSHWADPAYWLALRGGAGRHRFLSPGGGGSPPRRSRRNRQGRPGPGHLHHRLGPDILGEPGRDCSLSAPRLSDRAPSRVSPAAARQPADILVLLPFWTSVLVRTTAWLVLLQREGVVNDLAVRLGITATRIELVHNRFGVYVAMVHILLPFMVLPIYSVMRRISPQHMRAAASLGARPLLAFRKVYLPQSLPGVIGGCLLVFILALGFYVTPALVGGASRPADQLLHRAVRQRDRQLGHGGRPERHPPRDRRRAARRVPVARRAESS